MARTISKASPDYPAPSASNATSSGRIIKSRSEQPSSRSTHMTRQRSQILEAASSSGLLQGMVDEAQDVIADSSSSRRRGKSSANFETVRRDMDFEASTFHADEFGEQQDSMDDVQRDDEDFDMQQALLESVPANEICPITDKDKKPFPIMNLPTEIRLEIYRACLTRPYDILLSKREKSRREPDVELDKSGLSLSDSQSDAEETESEPPPSAIDQSAPSARGTPNRHSSQTHDIRNVPSRTARPLRSLSGRLALGHSNEQSDNDLTTSHGPLTQVGASRPAGRLNRIRQTPLRNHPRHRNTSVPITEPPRNQSQDPLLVNILHVSKEVYKEARGVLYNENKFNLDLNTAMSTLSFLHQRSRRQIKHVELEIPTYNEILERFQETVRLSLRYCTGLKTFIIHMPFTLPGADGSGTTGNTTVYANGFDILRWLPQECNIILKGHVCTEIEVVVNKHLHLAKTLDKYAYARRQLISNDTGGTSHATATVC